MKVVDGAPFVTMHWSRLSKTFGEYCYEELPKKIVSLTKNIERSDFDFNTYETATKHKHINVEVQG